MKQDQIFEEWKESLGYDYVDMMDYMNTIQSYIDFAQYYLKKHHRNHKWNEELSI